MTPARQALGLPAIVLLMLLACLPRAILGLLATTSGGDWSNSYETVARNIFLNGCISLSDPATAACVPSWGGNQGPGFAAFVAAIWSAFGPSQQAIVIAQSLVVALAVVAAAIATHALTGHRRTALAVGGVLAVSPQHLAWARFLSTDTLTVAFVLLTIAALLHGLARQRLSAWWIAIVMTGALAVRLDAILLVMPIALAAFLIYPPRRAIRLGLLVGLVLLVPAGPWTARNLGAGLTVSPPEFFSPRFDMPAGYVRWGYSWTVSEYQYPGWYNPAVSGNYDRIVIDPAAFRSQAERQEVDALLLQLRGLNGQPIPAHIDDAFARLAAAHYADEPFRFYGLYPFKRIANMWFNPFNSTAWPVETPAGADGAAWPDGFALISLALANPVAALVKGGAGLHRLLLLGLAGWLLVLSLGRGQRGTWRHFVWIATFYAVARTVFFAWFPLVETRYIMPAIPWLEVAVVLGLMRARWSEAANDETGRQAATSRPSSTATPVNVKAAAYSP